jgi:hypothetical protein
MEAVRFEGITVLYQATWHHIPEERSLQDES